MTLETDALRELEADLAIIGAEVARDNPSARCTILRQRPNSSFGISFLFPDERDPDLLDLEIDPRFGMLVADVVWGHPSGYVECSWTDEPQPLTDDAVTRLRAELPRLVAALRAALARGSPPA